jgi:D-alanine-D-alanine ligase
MLAQARVLLLAGGTSDERAVALETARAVEASLRDGADGRGPRALVCVEWRSDGLFDWRAEGRHERVGPAAFLAFAAGFDAVFLALHGGAGEDGTVQGALELVGVPFTGSGVAASALAMDKTRALEFAASLGLRVPRGVRVGRDDPARGLEAALAFGDRGWMVKPNRGGSSLVATRLIGSEAQPERLAAAVAAVHSAGDDARVEELVEGVELTCPILGAGAEARCLPSVEILPAQGRYFDYEQKYSSDGALERCPPESVAVSRVSEAAAAALRVHRELGCRGLTRVDYLVPESGPAVFLEINTLPGLTPRSLAPLAAAREGQNHRDLCLALLEQALAHKGLVRGSERGAE